MNFVKKKTIQIFANGSIFTSTTFFKQIDKIKIYEKDHTTSTFYKKPLNKSTSLKNFQNFKTKYLKF